MKILDIWKFRIFARVSIIIICTKRSKFIDPDHVVQIPLSDYVKKLDVKVRERYLKKISTTGIDPVLIDGKRLEPDCLPSAESSDFLCYLVLETSYYTQKQFKPSGVSKSTIKWCRALFATLAVMNATELVLKIRPEKKVKSLRDLNPWPLHRYRY